MARDPVPAHLKKNLPPLSLYVPEPKFRPGDAVDFTQVPIPAAGETRRPDIGDTAQSFTDLAYQLVRVLDEDGQAVGPWNPRLSPDTLRAMLRSMRRSVRLTSACSARSGRARRAST